MNVPYVKGSWSGLRISTLSTSEERPRWCASYPMYATRFQTVRNNLSIMAVPFINSSIPFQFPSIANLRMCVQVANTSVKSKKTNRLITNNNDTLAPIMDCHQLNGPETHP